MALAVKERIEERMDALGLSQTALAAKVGVSSSYLSDLLNGNRGGRSMEKWGPLIAKALGEDVNELFPDLRPAAPDAEGGTL